MSCDELRLRSHRIAAPALCDDPSPDETDARAHLQSTINQSIDGPKSSDEATNHPDETDARAHLAKRTQPID